MIFYHTYVSSNDAVKNDVYEISINFTNTSGVYKITTYGVYKNTNVYKISIKFILKIETWYFWYNVALKN